MMDSYIRKLKKDNDATDVNWAK